MIGTLSKLSCLRFDCILFDSTDRSKFGIARYHKAGGAARFWVCLTCSYAEKWYFAMARCQFEPCFWWENGPAQDDRAAKYTPKPGTVSQFQSFAAALLQIDSSDWEWKGKLLHQLGRRSELILQISCISVSVYLLNRRESKRECGINDYRWRWYENGLYKCANVCTFKVQDVFGEWWNHCVRSSRFVFCFWQEQPVIGFGCSHVQWQQSLVSCVWRTVPWWQFTLYQHMAQHARAF